MAERDGNEEQGRRRKYVQGPDESSESFRKRRNAGHQADHRARAKLANQENAKVLVAMQSNGMAAEDEDFFVNKVVGSKNYNKPDSMAKFKKCSKEVASRVSINAVSVCIRDIQRKGARRDMSSAEYEIGFRLDHERNVGDKGTLTKKEQIKGLPRFDWLRVKKSTIEGAGYGLFADRDFKKGDILGLYMGGKNGLPNCAIETDWATITCFPLTDARAQEDRSKITMGMQMMNDSTLYLDGEAKVAGAEKINAVFYKDLFVQATKDIKKGEEIFVLCNWKEGTSSEEEAPMVAHAAQGQGIALGEEEEEEEVEDSSDGDLGDIDWAESDEDDGNKKPKAKSTRV